MMFRARAATAGGSGRLQVYRQNTSAAEAAERGLPGNVRRGNGHRTGIRAVTGIPKLVRSEACLKAEAASEAAAQAAAEA